MSEGVAVVHGDGAGRATGLVRFRGRTLRCALGRAGIVPAARKHEGDGGTPASLLPLRRLWYRADRLAPPVCTVPRAPIAPDDLWCDDPAHEAYNRPARRPFEASHEAMWRDDALYDVVGELGWNDAPVVPQRGSAIFVHLARPDWGPTEGCVALALPDLLWLRAEGASALDVRA